MTMMTTKEFKKAEREAISECINKNYECIDKDYVIQKQLFEDSYILYDKDHSIHSITNCNGDRLILIFDNKITAKSYLEYINYFCSDISIDGYLRYRDSKLHYIDRFYFNNGYKNYIYITEYDLKTIFNNFKYYINHKYSGTLKGYTILLNQKTAFQINNKYLIFNSPKDANKFMDNVYIDNNEHQTYSVVLKVYYIDNTSSVYNTNILYIDNDDIDIMISMKNRGEDPYKFIDPHDNNTSNNYVFNNKWNCVLYSYNLGNYYFINDKIAAFNTMEDANKFKKSVGIDDTYTNLLVFVSSVDKDRYIIIDPNEDTYTDPSKKMQLNINDVDEYVNIHSYLGTDLNTAEKRRILLKFHNRGIYINYKYKILAFRSDKAADEFIEKSNLKDAPIDKYCIDVSKNDILYLHADGCFFADADLNELVVPEDKEEETAKIEGLDAESVSVNLDYDGITIIPDNDKSKKIYIPIECITKFINSLL